MRAPWRPWRSWRRTRQQEPTRQETVLDPVAVVARDLGWRNGNLPLLPVVPDPGPAALLADPVAGYHRTEAARIQRWQAMGPSPMDRLDPHPHRDMYPAPGYTDTYGIE